MHAGTVHPMKKAILLLALGCGCGAESGDGDSDSFERTVYTDTEPPAEQVTDSAGAWSCIGQAPVMAERELGRVQYALSVVDFDSLSSVPGLETKVCADPGCTRELPPCNGNVVECYELSAESQALTFVFPSEFSGTLRLSAPGYVAVDYVLSGGAMAQPVRMPSSDTMDRIYSGLQLVPFDASRGMLLLRALDCHDQPAAGVQITPIAGSILNRAVPFTLSLDDSAATGEPVTNESGVVGFASLAPDAATVVAASPDGAEYARATVLVRSNVLAIHDLAPRTAGQ
jgi:hypothetical protein